jgi:hypothetical protein
MFVSSRSRLLIVLPFIVGTLPAHAEPEDIRVRTVDGHTQFARLAEWVTDPSGPLCGCGRRRARGESRICLI